MNHERNLWPIRVPYIYKYIHVPTANRIYDEKPPYTDESEYVQLCMAQKYPSIRTKRETNKNSCAASGKNISCIATVSLTLRFHSGAVARNERTTEIENERQRIW